MPRDVALLPVSLLNNPTAEVRLADSRFFLTMGCKNSVFSGYTAEQLDEEVAKVAPRLPVAELMNGGIIKLEGPNGLFNPDSLLDPGWLRGRMTLEEYRDAINHINKCTAYSHIGMTKIFMTSEQPMRDRLRREAGMAAVEELNQHYRSVRFTYQSTNENMQINTSADSDRLTRMANRRGPPVAHASKTILFIAIQ